mgnify:CR=1 FL=1
MTALKWTITTQERNALVETHLGCIWWTINKNRRLISAAGLDDEDVFQQLAIRMIRAVENYDPDKGKDLEQHIFAQLQYEVLNCKDAAKLYGIKGAPYGARDLTVSLDALVETGVQFCGGGGGLNVKVQKRVRRDRLRPVFPNAGRGRSHRTGHSSPFPRNGPRVRAYGLVGPVLQPGRRVRLYRTGKEEAA